MEVEDRGKDEKFEERSVPKHISDMLKRGLLYNHRNDGLTVFLATEKKRKA